MTLGDGVQLGGGAGIADHVTIGTGAQLAAGSGLMHDIPAGERWAGFPAAPFDQTFRQIAALGGSWRRSSKEGQGWRVTVKSTLDALDIGDLLRMLPHRYPFLLVDRIHSIDGDNSAIGIKNVTVNEPHFQGHFPGQPVMPGVLIIEAMAQTAGAICLSKMRSGKPSLVYFMTIDNAKFRRPVVPGDRLELHVRKLKNRGNIWKYACEAIVDGTKVAEAEITAMMTPDAGYRLDLMQSETFIHPLSVVEPGAELGEGVRIGPFCHIGPDVADRRRRRDRQPCRDHGRDHDRRRHAHFSAGGARRVAAKRQAQGRAHDAGHRQPTARSAKASTMHVGTDTSRGETVVGDNGNFLAYTHVAHDCIVGKNATFANGATLAGHCEIGDNVIIGGLTAIHQFARIGDNAFLSGCSAIPGDVIPFGIARGNLAKLRGLNIIGMQRSGLPRAEIHAARRAYRAVFDRGPADLREPRRRRGRVRQLRRRR